MINLVAKVKTLRAGCLVYTTPGVNLGVYPRL